MSTEFLYTTNKFELEKWNQLCKQWDETFEKELYHGANFSKKNNSSLYISGVGSVRGFHVEISENRAEVSLPIMASSDDLRRAFSFLNLALKQGGGSVSDDEGNTYTIENLVDEKAKEIAQEMLSKSIQIVRSISKRDESPVQLPTPFFNLTFAEEELKLGDEELVALAMQRFKRYAKAFRPSMKFRVNEGDAVAWAYIESIFPKVNYLVIQANDLSTMFHVAWSHLEEVLGELIEDVGNNRYFLPDAKDIGEEKMKRLLEKSQPFEDKDAGETSEESAILSVLAISPLAVCMAVSAADGKIDKKEFKAAIKLIVELADTVTSEPVKKVLQNCIVNIETFTQMITPNILAGLLSKMPKAMKHHFSDEDKEIFIGVLVSIMKSTADASGGFLGFGNRISKEEKEVMTKVENLLRSDSES